MYVVPGKRARARSAAAAAVSGKAVTAWQRAVGVARRLLTTKGTDPDGEVGVGGAGQGVAIVAVVTLGAAHRAVRTGLLNNNQKFKNLFKLSAVCF